MIFTTPNKIKEFLISKIHGLLYKLENTGDSDYHRSGEESFIKNISDFYYNKDFTLFDVGANNGAYTEIILKSIKSKKNRLRLFEPQKSCFSALQQKFLSEKNIIINAVGLSNESSVSVLYKDSEQSELASLFKRNLKHYNINNNITETVKLETGKNYVEKNNISKVNLLKIDVEGNELDVLRGFDSFISPDKVDFIQFEYGGANLDSHTTLLELHEYLTAKGFILCKMLKNSLQIRSYHPRLENFMYQNWVAVSPSVLNNK